MGDIVRRVSKANPKLSELVIPEGEVLFNEGDKASELPNGVSFWAWSYCVYGKF